MGIAIIGFMILLILIILVFKQYNILTDLKILSSSLIYKAIVNFCIFRTYSIYFCFYCNFLYIVSMHIESLKNFYLSPFTNSFIAVFSLVYLSIKKEQRIYLSSLFFIIFIYFAVTFDSNSGAYTASP